MIQPTILCVDDQREVLSSLLKDIDELSSHFDLVECESAAEAMEVLEDLDAQGLPIALIISDHVMPDQSGVEFLTEVHRDNRFIFTKKLLLTGLATHEDTIDAINNARINAYIAKPWDLGALLKTIKNLLTNFVFDMDMDYRDFVPLMDDTVIMERSR